MMYPFTIYGLREAGSNEIRYVGQTGGTSARRLRQHIGAAHRCEPKTAFATWICENEIEAVDLLIESTCRVGAVENERIIIKSMAAAGNRLFNRCHLTPATSPRRRGAEA